MSTQNTHLIKRTKDHLSKSSWEIFNDRFCAVATIQKQMWFLCSQNRTVSSQRALVLTLLVIGRYNHKMCRNKSNKSLISTDFMAVLPV